MVFLALHRGAGMGVVGNGYRQRCSVVNEGFRLLCQALEFVIGGQTARNTRVATKAVNGAAHLGSVFDAALLPLQHLLRTSLSPGTIQACQLQSVFFQK